jgi:hypothetical protein
VLRAQLNPHHNPRTRHVRVKQKNSKILSLVFSCLLRSNGENRRIAQVAKKRRFDAENSPLSAVVSQLYHVRFVPFQNGSQEKDVYKLLSLVNFSFLR